ncbi:MAG: molybdenum cofactor biosynthesis protein MoaE [Candidatus Thermoplasmatota archaeon]|jgi:molybdopterin synthase catalytic subunit|nr:molybdenum cofactor biosynthesis protein MoaE [Candidatus Thermoplasmatota archaeon]MCL5881635.1 molybdenum cofactor biosynthesis protein MoaE [Candidatus Thermoplasmatota archaeon]
MLIRIQEEPIDYGDLIEKIRSESVGAIVSFLGTVRNTSVNLKVSGLEYSSYREMALRMMGEIAEEAVKKYGITDYAIVHRLGRLNLKEDSVAVCVASPHRKQGFRACEFIIDSIKEKVPIWKKDIAEGGEGKWRD